MSLSKCYQYVLTNKNASNKEISIYEHSNECIDLNTINTNDEMINNLITCDGLILEANFHDVWDECNETL